MRLICVSNYTSSLGTYEAGQDVNVSDDEAALLIRTSPGSFKRPDAPPEPVAEETPEQPRAEVPRETTAMSTETQTGLTAPDRRARGGKKRGPGN